MEISTVLLKGKARRGADLHLAVVRQEGDFAATLAEPFWCGLPTGMSSEALIQHARTHATALTWRVTHLPSGRSLGMWEMTAETAAEALPHVARIAAPYVAGFTGRPPHKSVFPEHLPDELAREVAAAAARVAAAQGGGAAHTTVDNITEDKSEVCND